MMPCVFDHVCSLGAVAANDCGDHEGDHRQVHDRANDEEDDEQSIELPRFGRRVAEDALIMLDAHWSAVSEVCAGSRGVSDCGAVLLISSARLLTASLLG